MDKLPPWDPYTADQVMAIFNSPPSASEREAYFFHQGEPSRKESLKVEFICQARTYANQGWISLEMKAGPNRPYVVQRIHDFLRAIESRRTYPFTKNFAYEPSKHTFRPSDWAVIQVLMEAIRQEDEYRQAFGKPYGYQLIQDRSLYLPPHIWDKLIPLWNEDVSMTFEYGLHAHPTLDIVQGEPPLRVELTKPTSAYYQLDFHNLDQIEVLDKYGYALFDGKLYRLKPAQLSRLRELKTSLDRTHPKQIRYSSDELEPVMNRMLRGLRTIAAVSMARNITERVVDVPLRAKLYLDRMDDTIIAGLEYVYDDVSFDPLEPEPDTYAGSANRFILRDAEQEAQILDALIAAGFQRDEGRLWLEGEDAVFEFLYFTLPQLEKRMQVYATSQFKPIVSRIVTTPKISVDWPDKTQWLEVKFELPGFGEEDVRRVLQNVVEKRRYVRLKSGAFFSLEDEAFRELERVMRELNLRKSLIGGSQLQVSLARGLPLLSSADDLRNLKLRLGKPFRQLLNHLRNPDALEFPVPAEQAAILRDYQTYGYQWMKTLAHYGFSGILADDMGLGKTLQAIVYLVSELDRIRNDGTPALIVCPASLIYNWKNEIARFAPSLRAEVIAGAKRERTELMQTLAGTDVWITSYPLLRRDMELYRGTRFHTLILDEAQAFKNHATLTAQTVKEIDAVHRFGLTGTPVENSLDELWSIYDAIFPELFEGLRSFQDMSRDEVARRIRPFLLRRMKQDVLKELPDKIETLQASELHEEQKQLYKTYLAKLKKETAVQLSREGFQKSRLRILAGLPRLRQLCCHPSLFLEDYKGGSAKLEQLMELLEEALASGRRILLFSQFTSMLSLIRRELEARGESYFYLDGSTPAAERVELCRRFNEGEQELFLISLKAGGTGLNLPGADTVILYDLWWNPAVEQQAIDRAHRIGQTNVVQVIRLIAQGTVEEKMHELQQKKKDLFDQVIQAGDEGFGALSEEDLREILEL